MAREHARIQTRIWRDDADWRVLDWEAQHMYLLLISQPTLSYAGTLAVTLHRWARYTAGRTGDDLAKVLQTLEASRFIVVDWDTEELLVRTFIRNDGIHKQPNVLKSAMRDALQVESPLLRAALAVELANLGFTAYAQQLNPSGNPSPDPSPNPSGKGSSPQVDAAVTADAKIAAGNPSRNPSRNPSAWVAGEGGRGSSCSYVGENSTSTDQKQAARKTAREPDPPGFAEFWTAYPRRVAKRAAAKAYAAAVKRGAEPHELLVAARRYAATTTHADPRFVPHPATWLNEGRHEDEPGTALAVANGRPQQPARIPTTTQRVTDALSLLDPEAP